VVVSAEAPSVGMLLGDVDDTSETAIRYDFIFKLKYSN
jgi:hypothetical protein